jgi:hypothetical protein
MGALRKGLEIVKGLSQKILSGGGRLGGAQRPVLHYKA